MNFNLAVFILLIIIAFNTCGLDDSLNEIHDWTKISAVCVCEDKDMKGE